MARRLDWCFTDFEHLDEDHYDEWYNAGGIQYIIAQVEQCPDTGRQHVQGYVIFDTRKRFSALKKIDPARHWSPRMAPLRQQAADYCRKDESRVGWSRQWGLFEEDQHGKRSDLVAIKRKLDEGASVEDIARSDEHFTDWVRYNRAFDTYKRMCVEKRSWVPEVFVFWGPPGVGKTRRVMEETKGAVYTKPPNSHWFDGYDGCSDVLLDDYDGYLPFRYLLQLLDRYPMQVQTKGAHINFAPKRIFLTSHTPVESWYPAATDIDMAALKRRITQIIHLSVNGQVAE